MSFTAENITKEELLNYAIENGMLDPEAILQEKEMKEKEKVLNEFPHDIWQGKDGRWRTYIYEELDDGTKKRKMIVKPTKTAVENYIFEHYKAKKQKPVTFDDAYHKWREIHDLSLSGSSIAKYNSDYQRYFAKTKFKKKYIADITEEDVKAFLISTAKDQKLCRKAEKTLFGYVYNTLKSSCINHTIRENPMQFMEPKQFYKFCTENEKPISEKTVSDEEMKVLYQRFYEDYEKHPSYITTYAVEFATLTGMRVGEISALKWDCIFDKYILIDKSEKYNKITKEYYIDGTKTGRSRTYPVTDEIRDLLRRVKKAEMESGYFCEWVFANEEGRIHAPVISSCSRNKCRQVGIPDKGIHAYRRTLNSIMKKDGVSTKVASSLLGHSEQVNEQCYTFDISTSDEKEKIIAEANAKMPHEKTRIS